MGLSIQDYLKKINSWLRFTDIASLFATFLILALFASYVGYMQITSQSQVSYIEYSGGEASTLGLISDEGKPFGSRKGKTYTFSWCSGSGNIKATNKIYFANEDSAKQTGRTLSKLCKK